MRKNTRTKPHSQKKKAAPVMGAAEKIDTSKRKTLKKLRNSTIGVILVGGAGAYFYDAYLSDLEERDLTKIGRGKPTIVQIHDPNCPMCTALQKATRSALANFQEGELQYLVANIRTTEGQQFANKYNVPHVTLLLFNKSGKLQNILQGVRGEEELHGFFRDLVKKS